MTGTFNQNIKNKFIEELIADAASNNSHYYVSFGKFFEWPDDNNPPLPNTSIKESFYDVSRETLFGKKLDSTTNFAYIFRKVNWTANTVYDYYSHLDKDLYSKDFYVINAQKRVYKCLFNNYGAASTVEPTLTINNGDFDTADGYKWKYMFTINSVNDKRFSTDTYAPVVPSVSVQQFAESGAVHVVVVENGGNNYISSNGTFVTILSNTQFILTNATSSSTSGAYNNSAIYIYSGNGSGGYSVISNYTVNSTGRYVTTVDSIPNLDTTSVYYIAPYVYFSGDGYNAKAIAHVNTATTKIESIEVINRGLSYSYANVSIISNSYFGSNATAYTIISPQNGHGSDPISELGSDILGISVKTTGTDNFPSWAKYRQVSLMYNPKASSNLQLYTGATFNQMTNFVLAPGSKTGDINSGDSLLGLGRQGTATVLYSNTTHIYVLNEAGTFIAGETVQSLGTGKTAVISSINNKDLVPFSGEIFYYNNIEPINRTGITSEEVKLYFNF